MDHVAEGEERNPNNVGSCVVCESQIAIMYLARNKARWAVATAAGRGRATPMKLHAELVSLPEQFAAKKKDQQLSDSITAE